MRSIEQKAEAVEGWLSSDEGRLLYKLAKKCTGRGVIVEIGSWKGKSTIWLAHGSRDGSNALVHAIDPHTGSPQHHEMYGGKVWTFEQFQKNMENAGVRDVIVPHVDFSHNVAQTFDLPVEAIFIDGLHEYEGVKIDFDDWFPKVIDGGHMAFHDTTCWPGVLKVVVDGVFKSRSFRRVRFAGSIVAAQKVAQNTFIERIGNRVMLCVFLVYAAKERFIWRLFHHHLDCEFTRRAIAWAKNRRKRPIAAVSVPVASRPAEPAAVSGASAVEVPTTIPVSTINSVSGVASATGSGAATVATPMS